ncbi:MAG: glycosyltransferase, partial [Lachnospiraceae bacterium]|nr:glycosyltransferase [Lachnospiraceae bacterium]
MGIKKVVKDFLAGRCLKEYEEKLKTQKIEYADWEKERECSLLTEIELPIQEILYEELPFPGDFSLPAEGLCLFHSGGGRLAANALSLCSAFADKNPEAFLFYGDEDELQPEGAYANPYFKPDWSPHTYQSAFYIGSAFAAKASFVKQCLSKLSQKDLAFLQGDALAPEEIMGESFSVLAFEAMTAADRLFCLLAREAGDAAIGHLPEILFHRDQGTDLFQGRRHKDRNGVYITKNNQKSPLNKNEPQNPSSIALSIVIPSKDHPELLKTCVESLLPNGAEELPYEIIVIDNGSDAGNKAKYEEILRTLPLEKGLRHTAYVYKPMAFNFSKMCNMGAGQAQG